MARFEAVEAVAFRPDDMAALVADVASYPRFIPWVRAARLWNSHTGAGERGFNAELLIGYKAFRATFATSVLATDTPLAVRTRLIRGPLRALSCDWTFQPSATGCLIEVVLDFEFSEPVLAALLRDNMGKAVSRLVKAFTGEAERRYPRIV